MAITPVAGKTHDITITDGAGVETGYMLVRDPEKGAPALRISRAPVVSAQQFSGQAQFTDQPVENDLHWEIRTFHRGALSYRWTPETDGFYNEASGVDAHTPNEFSLGNLVRGPLGPSIPDPSFEQWSSSTALSFWTTNSPATITRNTNSRTGTYALGIDTASSNVTGISYGLATPTEYQSKTVYIGFWVRRPAGATASVTVNMRLVDQASNQILASASVGTGQTTYTFVSASGTVDAAATSLTVRLYVSTGHSETVTPLAIIDDAFVAFGDQNANARNMIEFSDGLYAGVGNAACKWNETNDLFDVVLGRTANQNLGVSANDNRLISGDVGATTFNTSTDGATWTSGVTGMAGPYATIRDRIWGRRTDASIESSTDMDGTPTLVTYSGIGTSNRAINGLFAFDDLVIIGKEDGLWAYNRAVDEFQDLTPEFQANPSTEHFTRGIQWGGWLYLNTRRGVFRFNGVSYQDLSNLFNGPRLADFGGRIRAFAAGDNEAYVLMDTPTSDATANKTTWLLGFRDHQDGGLMIHTLHELTIGDIQNAYVWNNGTDTHLYIIGRRFDSGSSYHSVAYRLKIPARHDSPARDVTPDLAASGTLVTQYWDGMFPNTVKIFSVMDIHVEGADSGKTAKVEFQLDDDTSWTTLGTVSSNGISTLNFSGVALAKRSGKRIRFQFTLASDSTTAGPRVLMPIVLHTIIRPTRLKTYEADVEVSDGLQLLNGGHETNSVATLDTRLHGYVDSTDWPVTLKEDENGDNTVTSHTVLVRDVTLVKIEEDAETKQRRLVYRITAVERHA